MNTIMPEVIGASLFMIGIGLWLIRPILVNIAKQIKRLADQYEANTADHSTVCDMEPCGSYRTPQDGD